MPVSTAKPPWHPNQTRAQKPAEAWRAAVAPSVGHRLSADGRLPSDGVLEIEDGIVEFKNNNLSVLTSSILSLKDMDKNKVQDLIKTAEEEVNKSEISDQKRFLSDQKIDVLRSIH